MKTIRKAYNPAVHAENLEDIVFEGRNQAYGAYALRRNYTTRMNLSLLLVVSLASLIVFAAYYRTLHQPPPPETPKPKIQIIYTTPDNSDNLRPQPPKIKMPGNTHKIVSYKIPTVVGDDIEEDPRLLEEPYTPIQDYPDPSGELQVISGTSDPGTGIVQPPFEPWEVTEPPIFDGDFREWLTKHIIYPDAAASNQIFGTVTLKFAIDTDGNVCDISIIKGIHPLIDEAAIKALRSSPKWKPGKYNGNPVKSFYYLPVKFNLQGSI
jgi:periplasmic protein TonB